MLLKFSNFSSVLLGISVALWCNDCENTTDARRCKDCAVGALGILPVSDQNERGPEEWMRFFLQHFYLGRPQTCRQRPAGPRLPIEIQHQLVCCFVVDHPQTQQDGARTRGEETTREADQLVAGRDNVRAGFARAQRDQGIVELQAVGVANRERAVGEPQRGKKRIVGTELTVTRKVNNVCAGRVLTQRLGGRRVTRKRLRVRENFG